MLPGPVFTFELLTTARRGRFYLARAFYAVVLLLILWTVFASWSQANGGELTLEQVRWFALSVFCSIAIGQELLVLVLTPALVAGVIADEDAAQDVALPAGQPVDQLGDRAGKAAGPDALRRRPARRQPADPELAGAPGGDRPAAGAAGHRRHVEHRVVPGGTVDLGLDHRAAAAEALFVAFGLECLWLFSPLILRNLVTIRWPVFDTAANLIVEWVGASSPVDVYWQLFIGMVSARAVRWDLELIGWMIGLQLASGAVLAGLAAVQLHRSSAASRGAPGGVAACGRSWSRDRAGSGGFRSWAAGRCSGRSCTRENLAGSPGSSASC